MQKSPQQLIRRESVLDITKPIDLEIYCGGTEEKDYMDFETHKVSLSLLKGTIHLHNHKGSDSREARELLLGLKGIDSCREQSCIVLADIVEAAYSPEEWNGNHIYGKVFDLSWTELSSGELDVFGEVEDTFLSVMRFSHYDPIPLFESSGYIPEYIKSLNKGAFCPTCFPNVKNTIFYVSKDKSEIIVVPNYFIVGRKLIFTPTKAHDNEHSSKIHLFGYFSWLEKQRKGNPYVRTSAYRPLCKEIPKEQIKAFRNLVPKKDILSSLRKAHCKVLSVE